MVGCSWAEPKWRIMPAAALQGKSPRNRQLWSPGTNFRHFTAAGADVPKDMQLGRHWRCCSLDLGRPEVGAPGRVLRLEAPTSPSSVGSGFRVAYGFAPYACAVHLLFTPQALRLGEQVSLRGLSGEELLHCESDGGILCGGVRGRRQEDWCCLTGGLNQTPHKGTWKERPQHHGAQTVLVSGLCRSCRTPSIPELFLGRVEAVGT